MASDSDTPPQKTRRDLLIGLGIVAAVAGGWQAWVRRSQAFDFAPIDGAPGWRKLEFDGVSAATGGLGGAALLGLDGTPGQPEILPVGDLCRALFHRSEVGKVPIAAFSDFYCPYCRVLTQKLAERASRPAATVSVTWHELPLLGPASVIAAKAAVAADLQGGYVAFQNRLMGTQFRPTERFLGDTATATGLSAETLLGDMEGPEVARQLATSRAASRTLGIWGTPGVVVGRTLVMGAISDGDLDRLIELEAGNSPTC